MQILTKLFGSNSKRLYQIFGNQLKHLPNQFSNSRYEMADVVYLIIQLNYSVKLLELVIRTT